jgi:hypothetical protein
VSTEQRLAAAQAEHTVALREWLSSRGDAEPAALARLDRARAALRDAFAARVRHPIAQDWHR